MKVRNILSVVFALLSFGTAYFLYNRIHERNFEIKEITSVEEAVKQRLVLIREAQKGYFTKYKKYTSSLDTLSKFVEEDVFFITEKKEHIEMMSYGADSVWVTIDTLGTVLVKDTLFPVSKYGKVNFSDVKLLPHDNNIEFELWAGQNEGVELFQVEDPKPINPARQQGGTMPPLRVGSKTRATTKGNWEK